MQCKFGRVTFENVLKVAEGSTLSALAPAFAIALRTTNVAITNKAVEVCPLSLTLSLALSLSHAHFLSPSSSHTLSLTLALSQTHFFSFRSTNAAITNKAAEVCPHTLLSHTHCLPHTLALSPDQ